MKKTKKLFASVIKKAANHMIDSELCEWPPQCSIFYYQPVRPRRIEEAGNRKVQKKTGK